MANNCVSLLLYSLLASSLVRFGTQAVRIKINPAKCISTIENEVQISCLPDNDNDQEIIMLALSRNNEDPLVFINQCDTNPRLRDLSNQFQAIGQIFEEGEQSYLNVTLHSPKSQDTGIYTCVLYYLDKTGRVEMETASENLLVEKLDINSLETVLNELKTSIWTLTKKNDEFQQKALNKVAFSVGLVKEVATMAKTVLVFPEIIMQEGFGYNNNTGVFTAPVPGLYAFHLTVYIHIGCSMNMELSANDKALTRLGSQAHNWEMSSMSSVANLKAGDRVFAKMLDSGCTLYHGRYTSFNGYLINAF